jgi:hypothetical protein
MQIALTIVGEQPTLRAGVADMVSKAGAECKSDLLCGPPCSRCEQPREGGSSSA